MLKIIDQVFIRLALILIVFVFFLYMEAVHSDFKAMNQEISKMSSQLEQLNKSYQEGIEAIVIEAQ